MTHVAVYCVVAGMVAAGAIPVRQQWQGEKQLTFSPKNHELDSNDNFSADGRFLCYDTRETVGPGIDHGQTIEILEINTGREIVLYRPDEIAVGTAPAPGVGAVSFSLAAPEAAFIHGPLVSEVAERGPYGKPNRNGARVRLDGEMVDCGGEWRLLKEGKYCFSWIDARDVARDRDTLPGAHRGGTHRHEYCRSGKRIGFTYDDWLLPRYDRTIGYMEPNAAAPPPASHYFAVLVAVAPMDKARPGEIEKAYSDSWVDADGTMRAFIGKVRNEDGSGYEESLFAVDIPETVDIATADSGNAERYPAPPHGVRIRRLTHTWAGGIVRGSRDGKRIAYYGKDGSGLTQIFLIPADGSDKDPDPAKRPMQATFLPKGTESGLRWFPDGNYLLSVSEGGLAVTCIKPGPHFGASVFIVEGNNDAPCYAPAIDETGRRVAYNRLTPTYDAEGRRIKNYADLDFSQIFCCTLPDWATLFES